MGDDWKAAVYDLREEIRGVREEVREEVRRLGRHQTADPPRRSGDGVLFRSLLGAFALCGIGIGGAWVFDALRSDTPIAKQIEPQSRTTFKLVPYTVKRPIIREQEQTEDYIVFRPVTETKMVEQEYTVERPVRETVMEERKQMVERPVRTTTLRPQWVTVQRPLTETIMQSQSVTTPSLAPVWVNRFGFWTVEWQPVNSFSTQLVPTQTTRMVATQEMQRVPVEEVRYVEQEVVRKVPVERTRMVEQTKTRKAPVIETRYVEETRTRTVRRPVVEYVDETHYRYLPADAPTDTSAAEPAPVSAMPKPQL